MVATILALGGFSKTGSVPAIAKYYTDECNAAYYTDGGQRPGEWFGAGATALGLSGTVARSEFEQLLAGRSPDGQRMLTQSDSKKRRFRETLVHDDRAPLDETTRSDPKHKRRLHNPGYDLTLSVPKSVSVWWALADRTTQKRIDRVIDRVAKQILAYIQEELQLGRRGLAGKQEERAGLVAGLFHHYDNRNGDPQRHVHCVILTPCHRHDGTWASINGAKLRDWTRRSARCSVASSRRNSARPSVSTSRPAALRTRSAVPGSS